MAALSNIKCMGLIQDYTIVLLGLKVGVGEAREANVRDASDFRPEHVLVK